ncbi:hypothetical protein CYG49_04960 [Candidatus Saccharibacteria bacterium]|nr:MAG: hypothetical protein CYG49_04960 [Candidatus Saccharibacteria bacterium]
MASIRKLGAVALSGLMALALTGVTSPASAAPVSKVKGKRPILALSSVNCVGVSEQNPYGGTQVTLDVDDRRIPSGDSYTLVPVNVETGQPSGPAVAVMASQSSVTFVIPSDGVNPSPISDATLYYGGNVVDRERVFLQCGTPTEPQPEPTIDQPIEFVGAANLGETLVVEARNPNSVTELISVELFPNGSETLFAQQPLTLGAGESGSVTFTGVPLGDYTVVLTNSAGVETVVQITMEA